VAVDDGALVDGCLTVGGGGDQFSDVGAFHGEQGRSRPGRGSAPITTFVTV
jgi:hypothetical protein